jgi:ASPIC and UnbV./FG-GAP repeat.
VAREAGLHSKTIFGSEKKNKFLLETTGCGAAFFDFDNDGWLDIFLVNGTRFEAVYAAGQAPTNRLYRNNRDGTFTDVTLRSGLARTGWGQGVCAGDYDNDGREDLFVTYWGDCSLFHNNGDGTFTDVAAKAGVTTRTTSGLKRWNTGCAFLDYDRDGHLDLFVGNYIDFDPKTAPLPESGPCLYKGIMVACGPPGLQGGKNILFRNNGNGTFTDVSKPSGILKTAGTYSLGVLVADFDNDGWPDIYVACDTAPSRFYHNNHDGTFSEVGREIGCALNENGTAQGGMGVAIGDYDCDGWLDIVKTNYSDQTANVYHNNGNGTFYDAVFQAGLGANTNYLGWGVGLFDFDNDGWMDIFMSNGHVFPEVDTRKLHVSFRQKKLVYKNMGNGKFSDISSSVGSAVTDLHSSRGAAFGDFDNDGDVDVVVVNMNEPPSLLRNDCHTKNNWLKIKCIGTKSNRTAIGARVRVVTGSHSQINEVMSGSSYVSQNDLRLHFGLGKVRKLDLIEVRWPLGLVESFKDIEANQLLVLEESKGIIRQEKFGSIR